MSEKKFKFVSPGVFLNEIDNSQLPKQSDDVGPVIIGRSERGPALKPVRVESFSEFIEIFGAPLAGGLGDDTWREGNGYLAPTYAGYAVQAYLRNSSPVNFVRLLGVEDDDALASSAEGPGGAAGWAASNNGPGGTTLETAWGLFVGYRTPTGSVRPSVVIDKEAAGGFAADEWIRIEGGKSSTKVEFRFDVGAPKADCRGGLNVNGNPDGACGAGTNQDPYIIGLNGAADQEAIMERVEQALNYTGTADAENGLALGFGASALEKDGAAAAGSRFVLSSSLGGYAGNDLTVECFASNGTTVHPTVRVYASGSTTATTKFSGGTGPDFNASLAAALYTNPEGTDNAVDFTLQGTVLGETVGAGTVLTSSANLAISAAGSLKNPEFELVINQSHGDNKVVPISFDTTSKKFIRKVLNTNPVLTNTSITEDGDVYWLGETYEHALTRDVFGAATTGDEAFAFVAPLSNGSKTLGDWRYPVQGAKTGWFFSQWTDSTGSFDPNLAQKLFRFASLNEGESNNRDFKVSITDIRPPPKGGTNPYGSFSVVLRRAKDSDNAVQIVERFSNCNLNPYSGDYVARKIGDIKQEWSLSENRYKHYGNYPNMSRYIRIEMNSTVDQNFHPASLIPFGVFGPPVLETMSQTFEGADVTFGVAADPDPGAAWLGDIDINAAHGDYWLSASNPTFAADEESGIGATRRKNTAAKMKVGVLHTMLRHSASDGGIIDPTKAYFGLQTVRGSSSTRYDDGYVDLVRSRAADFGKDKWDADYSGGTEWSWVFTMDDIVTSGSNGNVAYYESGSYKAGNSATALEGEIKLLNEFGINKFTSPLYGGYDGVDITESEPFNNREIEAAAGDARASYEYASVKRAIDSVADAEVVEANLMAIPGLTDETLTTSLIRNCEARADSLAVIDLPDVFDPPQEHKHADFKDRIGSGVKSVAETFTQRGINSSYGCTYYPWLKIYDEITDSLVWVPPSVIALGVFANTERRAALWFAPAGFNRGGLTEGSAGLPVISVTERLSSKQRDDLYEANINPIATFPSEGIVVFGQKTLQTTRSALDRINVRRLLIYVKKEVSRIANRILFDQNVQSTWDRFLAQVTPFLDRVKQGYGLTDFKVILDKTTTTPDLVDRNIMYAKIFLKPARSIEFIAIDFIITNTGAAFED